MTAQVGTSALADGSSGWFDKLAQYRAVWSSPGLHHLHRDDLAHRRLLADEPGGHRHWPPGGRHIVVGGSGGQRDGLAAASARPRRRRHRRGQDRRWRRPRPAGTGVERRRTGDYCHCRRRGPGRIPLGRTGGLYDALRQGARRLHGRARRAGAGGPRRATAGNGATQERSGCRGRGAPVGPPQGRHHHYPPRRAYPD